MSGHDLPSGEPVVRLHAHTGAIVRMLPSPHGATAPWDSCVLTLGADGAVCIASLAAGACERVFAGDCRTPPRNLTTCSYCFIASSPAPLQLSQSGNCDAQVTLRCRPKWHGILNGAIWHAYATQLLMRVRRLCCRQRQALY